MPLLSVADRRLAHGGRRRLTGRNVENDLARPLEYLHGWDSIVRPALLCSDHSPSERRPQQIR
jgi:hypothetical protein